MGSPAAGSRHRNSGRHHAAAAPLSRLPDPGACPRSTAALPLTLPGAALIHWTVGGGLILIGVAIVAAGIRNFTRAATPVPTNQPVRALVTTGIHGCSSRGIRRVTVTALRARATAAVG